SYGDVIRNSILTAAVQPKPNIIPGAFIPMQSRKKESFNACGEEDVIADVDDSIPMFKRARMHSQCFRVTHELKRKRCKARPHHSANKKRRKK
ncbi:MAG: hypothetical protein EZS28_016971, partial [Streblomastix strix]